MIQFNYLMKPGCDETHPLDEKELKVAMEDAKNAPKILKDIQANPMGGWLDLPLKDRTEEIAKIRSATQKIQANSEILVCIGIGGSYLGHRAIIEALRPASKTKIIYAGNSLSERELNYALREVDGHDFSVNVISKSGTTLEPSLAFRAFKQKLIEKYGEKEAKTRIFATTDAEKGTLHDEAVKNGYEMFIIPDNIGGRYSVFTPVGLLPMAAAGVDIDELLKGAKAHRESLNNIDSPLIYGSDPTVQYAYTRHLRILHHLDTEVFATFEPATAYFLEWLKQLFGESEGKYEHAILPTSAVYSTDLHSLGQFMQEGRRNMFETLLVFPTDEKNSHLTEAVAAAHLAGNLPVDLITTDHYDTYGFGELMQFFMTACALSATFQNVNPFDQPGVEAYKKRLHELLG